MKTKLKAANWIGHFHLHYDIFSVNIHGLGKPSNLSKISQRAWAESRLKPILYSLLEIWALINPLVPPSI